MIRLGPFELDAQIGQGGMGEVWRAHHARQKTSVSVKLLTAESARDASFLVAFRNEVRAAASLDHPNIVLVYDYGEVDAAAELASASRLAMGTPYLVMELAEGGTLVGLAGRMGWIELRHVVLSLLDALAHAHARGVIHRDIKPGNVLISDYSGDLPTVKLTDFGLAHPMDGREDATHFFGGTPSFMAPEQFGGQWRDYGPWTDLYAFGCLVHSLIRGTPPFGSGASLREKRRLHLREEPPPLEPTFAVPAGLDAWVRRLMEKEPSKRFRRAADAAWAFLGLEEPADLAPPKRCSDTPCGADTLILGSLVTLREASRPDSVPRHPLPDVTGDVAMARIVGPADLPPLPSSWRRARRQWQGTQLLGAGLGLFGLRDVPLVDREDERDRLWRALERCRRDRQAAFVALVGPSGSGTSRLARWICERAHEVGAANVLRATHNPMPGLHLGLGPMIGTFLRCQGLGRTETRQRVQAIYPSMAHPDAWDAMTELIVPAAEEDRGGIRFRNSVERYVTLRRMLKAVCNERPLVVWLDDVQWGLDALGFARYILDHQRSSPQPILFVVTATEESLAEHSDEAALLGELLEYDASTQISIGALPQSHRAYLVESLLGLDEDLARRVEERTGGNPLFAVQLVGDWVERNLLIQGEKGYRLPSGSDIELPVDVRAMWAGRVQRLLAFRSEAEGCALELAAVLGTDIDVDEWLAVCDRSGGMAGFDNADPSEALLEGLLDLRLTLAGTGGPARGWSFAHVMLREAVVSRARDAGRLIRHHLVCARVLQEKSDYLQQPTRALEERIGRHLVASGQLEEALEPLLAGVEFRLMSGDFSVADALLDARDVAMEEAGVPASDERWGHGWLRRYGIAISRGDYDQVDLWLDRIRDAVARYPWPEVSLAGLCRRGQLARMRGDLSGAVNALGRVAVIAEEMEDRAVEGLAHYELGYAYADMGDLDRAEELTRKGLKVYEAIDDRHCVGRCWQSLGQIAMQCGNYGEAMSRLVQAEAIFKDCGDRWGMASTVNSMGDVARNNSDLPGAEKLYRRARGLLRAIGSQVWIFPDTNLGLIHLARQEHAEAQVILERAISAFMKTGHNAATIGCHLGLASCAASSSEWGLWDDHMSQASEMIDNSAHADVDAARCASYAGDAAVARGDVTRARSAYEISLRIWKVLGREHEVRDIEARIVRVS